MRLEHTACEMAGGVLHAFNTYAPCQPAEGCPAATRCCQLVEAALAQAAPQPELADPEQLLFDTAEVGVFLDRSRSWVSRGLRDGIFVYVDGTVVEPLRAAKGGHRRFTVSMVQAMAWSAYRRGSLSSVKLATVLNALSRALR